MMGVDYNLFWTLNPKELSPFIKAFSLREKHEDSVRWQQGLYFRSAIASCFNKDSKYPEKPIFTAEHKEIDPDEQQKIIKQRFMNHAMMLNGRFRKES